MHHAIKTTILATALAVGIAAPVKPAQAVVLKAGQSLSVGESITSDDNRYAVVMQGDGNLVVYRNDGIAFWSTQTAGSGATTAVMQEDGNFVLYTAGGQAVWSSRSWGRHRAFGVDRAGRAQIVRMDRMRKGDRHYESTLTGLQHKGAQPVWEANTFDGPHYQPRPNGPHCVGDPRACAEAERREIQRRLHVIRFPWG